MKLDLIFRSCSRVYAVHGGQRVVPASKSEIILRCLQSVIRSVEFALQQESGLSVSLTVVDDHSDPICVQAIQQRLRGAPFQTMFLPMLERVGNGPSLLTCYEYARENCEGLIYFVEDDYLHDLQTIFEMFDTHRRFSAELQREVALFPCDYPDLYKRYYSSAILLGNHRYWRKISHTTGTVMVTKKTLTDHWDHFMALTRYGIDPAVNEDTSINKVYQSVACFSPMPTLTVHMAAPEQSASPFVDWRRWWEENP